MNPEILSYNYRAARNDSNDGYGVVIVIYTKDLMVEENHFKFTGGNIESVKIKTFEKPVKFLATCRSSNNDNASNDSLIINLFAICKKYKNSPICISGHFNLSDVDWLSNDIIGHQYPEKLNEDFLDIFEQAKLTQTVDRWNRADLNKIKNVILISQRHHIPTKTTSNRFSQL